MTRVPRGAVGLRGQVLQRSHRVYHLCYKYLAARLFRVSEPSPCVSTFVVILTRVLPPSPLWQPICCYCRCGDKDQSSERPRLGSPLCVLRHCAACAVTAELELFFLHCVAWVHLGVGGLCGQTLQRPHHASYLRYVCFDCTSVHSVWSLYLARY